MTKTNKLKTNKLKANKQRKKNPMWCPCAPGVFLSFASLVDHRLVGLVVKASASRAEDPEFESCLPRDFSGIESYQWLQNWHYSDYPATRLA